jgi:hypothetical protein
MFVLAGDSTFAGSCSRTILCLICWPTGSPTEHSGRRKVWSVEELAGARKVDGLSRLPNTGYA